MKRQIFALFLIVALVATMFVGCGSDTANETTNTTNTVESVDEVESTEVDADVETETEVEPTETPDVEVTETSEVVEPTEEVVEENAETPITEDMFIDSYQWTFPEGMDGFTDKWIFDDVWSYNQTHFVDADGFETNLIWEGPVELGEQAVQNGTTLFLYGADKTYELRVWSCEVKGLEDALREFDKETIVGWVAKSSPYTEGDYYEFIDGDVDARVTFKVSRTIDGVDYTGYACFFENYDTMTCYQTGYVERNDVFDNERALAVVNSLDFWNDYSLVTE